MIPPELIARDNIPLVWPLVEPRLQAVMNKMKFVEIDTPNVFNLLLEEKAQLWIGGNGEMIMITRIISYPNVKRLIVDFIHGVNAKDYKEHMEYIEHWAVKLGATQAEAEIRPGLERLLKGIGWKHRRIKVFKNLKKGLH